MRTQARALTKKLAQADIGAACEVPALAIQHLWYSVSRAHTGATIAVVPVEPDVATGAMARDLGLVAAQQPTTRVLVVDASIRGCAPAFPATTKGVDGATLMGELTTSLDEPLGPNCDYVEFGRLDGEQARRALVHSPKLLTYLGDEGKNYGVAVFATDSPLYEASAIPLIRSLDRVALCVSLGRTTFAAARAIVELIGSERILGAVALT